MWRVLLGAICVVGIAACVEASVKPQALEISVEASRTSAAPGDTISFLVKVKGTSLLAVEADYGDNTFDLFGPSGARTAQINFRHPYSLRGTYSVVFTATEAVGGQKKVSVEIRVN